MGGIDLGKILDEYDEKHAGEKNIGGGSGKSAAETINSQENDPDALRKAVRNDRIAIEERADELKAERAKQGELSVSLAELEQRRIARTLTNSLACKNAQKMIILANRESMRRGLDKEVTVGGGGQTVRVAQKGQVSSVSIPTQLLRYIQREIGGLSTRMTQNDLAAGFLYWYFGQPDDVAFPPETAKKIEEIAGNLDLGASPSRMSRASYNASAALADKIDTLAEKVDLMIDAVAKAARNTSDIKLKSDKSYIGICYAILSLLAFTPPVMAGMGPKDIDMLSGGDVWDLMGGIDEAYDYFTARNGREIYKAKVRQRVKAYAPPAQQVFDSQPVDSGYEDYDYDDDNEDYQDVYMGEVDDDESSIIMYVDMDQADSGDYTFDDNDEFDFGDSAKYKPNNDGDDGE